MSTSVPAIMILTSLLYCLLNPDGSNRLLPGGNLLQFPRLLCLEFLMKKAAFPAKGMFPTTANAAWQHGFRFEGREIARTV